MLALVGRKLKPAPINPDWKLFTCAVGFPTCTSCDPGVTPTTPVKINPVGNSCGPRLNPAGNTVRITVITCGVLAAGADTCILP